LIPNLGVKDPKFSPVAIDSVCTLKIDVQGLNFSNICIFVTN